MSSIILDPRFERDQAVKFIGGSGKIKNHHYESGSWFYYVEMAMGSEPDFGRVGCETMILLSESELLSELDMISLID